METKLYEKPSGRRNAKSDIFGSSQPHVFGLLLDPLMPVLAEMMLGVHVQDKRRILFYKPYQKTRQVLRCMGPLHFKPLSLAIESADLVLLFRLQASFVDMLYIPLGTSSRQTQSTCSSDVIPQHSVDEPQK